MSSKPWLNKLSFTGLFVVLTAAGAYIRLPFRPFLPTTLQLFFVLLAGFVLGPYFGALSQAVYAVLGLAGVPFFNTLTFGFPRPSFFASPDFMRAWLPFGYLLGFMAAAFFVGRVTEVKKRDFWTLALVMSAAVFIIYDFGVIYFIALRIPLHPPFLISLSGFIAVDLVKGLAAAAVAYRLSPLLSLSGDNQSADG